MDRSQNTYWCYYLVLLLCFDSLIVGSFGQHNVGDYCRLQGGETGVCQLLNQCPSAQILAQARMKLDVCGHRGGSLVVCCPVQEYEVSLDNSPQESSRTIKRQGFDYDYEDPSVPNQSPGNQPWWANNNQGNRPFKPTTTTKAPWWLNTERPSRPVQTTTRRPPVTTTRYRTTTRRNDVWGNNQNIRPTTRRPTPVNLPPATGVRKAEQKCTEYSRQVEVNVMAIPLLPVADPISVTKEKCDYKGLELIVGGTETQPGEFPHMAAIGYRSNGKIDWDCGGSLISDFFIMTAAHCTYSSKGEPYMVRLGELNLKREDDGAKPVDYRVAAIIRHPEYKPPARYNDIALLRMATQVKFNDFIRPACLYTQDTFSVNKTMATGWGQIDYAEEPSEILLKVAINIIGNDVCNHLYRSDKKTDRLRQGIAPTMMCAGDLNGGKDTCQGDSGGPIQITHRKNQCLFYVIGVTSFGKFCAGKNAPGVYTRVSSYVPWIEKVAWP